MNARELELVLRLLEVLDAPLHWMLPAEAR